MGYLQHNRSSKVARSIAIALIGLASVNSAISISSARASDAVPTKSGPVHLIAVMGDSISAASMADLQLVPPTTPAPPQAPTLNLDPDLLQPTDAYLFQNKATYSWASGQKINSHVMRMNQYLTDHHLPGYATVLNAAIPGSRAADMPAQAQTIVNAVNTGKFASLDYVVLFVGGNDVCATGTPTAGTTDQMQKDLVKALQKIAEITSQPKIHVMVVEMPRVPDLGKPEIRNYPVMLSMNCETFRTKVFGLCQSMTVWRTFAEYRDRIRETMRENQAIIQAAQEAGANFSNLDVTYTDGVYYLPPAPELMAIDCFHPNAQGQDLISAQLWHDQPWFH